MKTISVYIKPGAKNQSVSVQKGLDGKKTYIVSVKSLPKEGAANKELVEVLSDYFRVGKSKIEIKSGFKSRHKIIIVHKV